MHAHVVGGIIHIIVIDHEHLAEVEGAAALAQYLALEEGKRGVVPTGAATVLILDAGDGQLLDNGERLLGIGGNGAALQILLG